jgi:hypothetical protein
MQAAPLRQAPVLASSPSATLRSAAARLPWNSTAATAGSGYDQLNVTGTVALTANAPLNISLGLGFTPADNQSFIVLRNDGVDGINVASGFFSNAGDPSPKAKRFTAAGQQFSISYVGGDGNDVALIAGAGTCSAVALLSGLGFIAALRRRRS